MIWSPDDVFSAGANLEALMPVFMKSGAKGIAPELKKFQDFMLRVRYARSLSSAPSAASRWAVVASWPSIRASAWRRWSYMGLVESAWAWCRAPAA